MVLHKWEEEQYIRDINGRLYILPVKLTRQES